MRGRAPSRQSKEIDKNRAWKDLGYKDIRIDKNNPGKIMIDIDTTNVSNFQNNKIVIENLPVMLNDEYSYNNNNDTINIVANYLEKQFIFKKYIIIGNPIVDVLRDTVIFIENNINIKQISINDERKY